jgi:hypothetical protein
MTGRERLRRILTRQPADRLAWTTLVDSNSLNLFPENLRGNGGLDFYKHLGCDIFLLDSWGLPIGFRSPRLNWGPDVRIESKAEGARQAVTWTTPWGTLNALYEKGHPLKYPVDSIEAVRLFRRLWEGAQYEAADDTATALEIDRQIGEHGVFTRFWGPSAIPRLLEVDMGAEHFYYLMADYPDDVEALIRVMHEKNLQAFDLLARSPCESVTLVENTSTYYISPAIYRDYNMPQQRDFVERVHRAGKPAILHMCGHVRNLLPLIKETGCDGIHALTPPPTGDCPWELALDALGDNLVIFGCLDPTIFTAGPVDGIGPALDRLITPRLRESPFVLAPFADGIPVPLERFYAVRDWVEKRGLR